MPLYRFELVDREREQGHERDYPADSPEAAKAALKAHLGPALQHYFVSEPREINDVECNDTGRYPPPPEPPEPQEPPEPPNTALLWFATSDTVPMATLHQLLCGLCILAGTLFLVFGVLAENNFEDRWTAVLITVGLFVLAIACATIATALTLLHKIATK